MGREKADPIDEEQRLNALHLLSRVNELLDQFYKENPKAQKRRINSGYRPAAYNVKIGGATHSKHMICAAVDISDEDKMLANWTTNEVLVKYDLYIEDPSKTTNWVHYQLVSPKSGKRKFLP